jgi:hypothetical protein
MVVSRECQQTTDSGESLTNDQKQCDEPTMFFLSFYDLLIFFIPHNVIDIYPD